MPYTFVPYFFPNNDNVTLSVGVYTTNDVPFINGVPAAMLDNFTPTNNASDFPLEVNVRDGISYGSGSFTGSLDLPIASNVKIGIVYDSAASTGTYDGTDRHTSPVESDVRLNVVWKSNSLTNNKTGTMISPTAVENATAVWDRATASHTTAGSFGVFVKKLLSVAKFLGLK